MATYVVPQVLVFQEFSVVPSAVANALRAHISGPHAKLIRYAESDEQALGRLGYYDRLIDTSYLWPERPAGGTPDTGYAKLWVKNAILQYFQDTISQGSTITKTAGYNNRIRSATVNFAENGDDFPRDDLFFDRDVKVGDIAKVRGLDGSSNSITLWTYVKALHGDVVASTVDAAEADADNASGQSASTSVVQTAGPENCVTLTPNGSAYAGLASGFVTETYDIIVTQSSVGGDYTTAKIRVISGSGEDDQTDITPEAAGSPTSIGTRGLVVVFNEIDTLACSASADADAVSDDDLIASQRWQVTVSQLFTAPVPTSGGSYDSFSSSTYIVSVTRGGRYSDTDVPQIKVTTTNGVDLSGPTDVTAASTPVDIGSKGVTIEFTGTGLRKGDRYYVEVVGKQEGPMRTIELGHNLSTDIAAASEVDLTLYILKPLLQIEKNRTGFAPLVNWETSATEFTVQSGITAYDETWTDGGVPMALDLYSESTKKYGELFLEIRYWLEELCSEVGTIQDIGEINSLISGALHPDNPLKWGVKEALENSNGAEVKFTAVCEPDNTASWTDVLELLEGRDDVYGLVPLTRNRTVLDAYAAHVGDMSNEINGLWRVLWVNLAGIPEIPVVHAGSSIAGHIEAATSDGLVALALVEDDSDTAGTQYTRVRVTSGNANLLELGVRSGDIFRCLFTSDGFGGAEYQEFVIDEVQSEDQFRLLTGPDAPINVAAKFEIWRNLSATEEAEAIALNAGAWGDRRVRATWPDRIEASGTVMEGYFLNCALAGLSSGVLPHQGLTHLEITGFTDVPRTNDKFNRAQRNILALGGVWIVEQDRNGSSVALGAIYSRHAKTSASNSDLNAREENVVRNVDSISYRFKDYLKPFIGVTNVTPVTEARLRMQVEALIDVLKSESSTINLGPQMIEGTIVEFGPHATERDRYVVKINVRVPYAVNVIELHLSI